jgi:hypothetical protein
MHILIIDGKSALVGFQSVHGGLDAVKGGCRPVLGGFQLIPEILRILLLERATIARAQVGLEFLNERIALVSDVHLGACGVCVSGKRASPFPGIRYSTG